MADNVVTGAIALVKSGGQVIAKLKSVRASEDITRGDVQGIGTILSSEAPVLKLKGTLSCSKMTVSYKDGIIPNAIRRNIKNIESQVTSSNPTASVEDNLVLDDTGLTIEIYKKVADVIDPATGQIKPKLSPLAIVTRAFLTTQSLDISEGSISGTDQSFVFLDPIVQ